MLKELVKQEREEGKGLAFSSKLASVLLKNLDEVVRSRAVFILLEFVEHAETKDLVIA